MADNVAQAVKDLQKELKALDDQLIRGQKSAQDLFDVIIKGTTRSGGSIRDIVSQRGEKLSAKEKNKLRIVTEFVNPKGEPLSAKDVEDAITDVQKAIDKDVNKREIRGLNIVYDKSQFEQLKKDLLELQKMQKDPVGTFDSMQIILGKMAPAKSTSGTAYSKAIATRITDERKAREEVLKLQEKQLKIQEAIERANKNKSGTAAFEGKRRSVEFLNKELEKTQNLISKQNAILQGSQSGRSVAKALGISDVSSGSAQKQQEQNFMRLNRLLNERRKLQREITLQGGQANETQSRYQRILNNDINNTIKAMRDLESKYSGITRRASEATMEQRMRRTKEATDQLNKSLRQTKTDLDSMIPVAQRLASAFGLAFSVRGLVDFGKKVVETSAQFEMQFVSLKHIIGDTDAATKLWSQTLQQALQSPMKAMDLLKYTKQLAAYRIETDKLFETTKRLADVSAGLGVDMQRLILAYGQVKAANYLRASEIRQFTEAGVNILGELASYFNEVKGMAVNTADVMQMVTKRMVKFEDVEAIFKRMTDEGGQFYDMQRIQSETVYGQIQKLHDAYDQMLYKIGQGNSGAIHDLIEALQWMVRHWREVADFIMQNITILAAWRIGVNLARVGWRKFGDVQKEFAIKTKSGVKSMQLMSLEVRKLNLQAKAAGVGVAALGAKFKLLGLNIRVAAMAMRSFLPMLAITAVVEGVAMLVNHLAHANDELDEFKDSLESLKFEAEGNLKKEQDEFEKLKKEIENTTEGTQARRDAVNKMNTEYGKYLKNLVTETMSVDELGKAYEGAKDKMAAYANEKLKMQINEEGNKEITQMLPGIIKEIEGEKIWHWTYDEKGNKKDIVSAGTFTRAQASNMVSLVLGQLQEAYAKGITYTQDELDQIFLRAAERVTGYGEGDMALHEDYKAALRNAMSSGIADYIENFRDFAVKYYEIKGISVTPMSFESEDARQKYEEANENYKRDKEFLEQMMNDNIESLMNTKNEEGRIHELILQEREEFYRKNKEIKEKYTEEGGAIIDDNMIGMRPRYDYDDDVPAGDVAYEKALAERVRANKIIQKKTKEWSKDYYMLAKWLLPTADDLKQGTKEFEEGLIRRKKELEEEIKRLKPKLNGFLKSFVQPAYDNAVLEVWGVTQAMTLRGVVDTNSSRSQQDSASRYISLIKEMRSEYDKLSKSAYGYAKSEGKVRESYKESIQAILGKAGVDKDFDFTTTKGTIAALEQVKAFLQTEEKAGRVTKDAWKDVQKYIDQLQTEVEMNVQVKIREDFGKEMEKMFGDYELTLDIQKLNLPNGVLADLFDIDNVSLADLRMRVSDFYKEQRSKEADPTDLIKQVEDYYKKLDDMERKQQRERIKDYAKYLEYELSERAKMEMEYVRKIAEVEAESAFSTDQKKEIQRRLKKEYEEKIAKQEWEEFKGSEMYVQMMEDLEHQGIESLQIMRHELERIRDNAENLSPRALKEVINAIEKINDIEVKRGGPISNIFRAKDALAAAKVDVSTVGLRESDVSSRAKTRELLADLEARNTQLQIEYNNVSKVLGKDEQYNRLLDEQTELRKKNEKENLAEYTEVGLKNEKSKLLDDIKNKQSEIEQLEKLQKISTEGQRNSLQEIINDKKNEINDDKKRLEILNKELTLRIQIATIELERETDPEKIEELKKQIKELEKQKKELEEQIGVVTKVEKAYQRLFDGVEDGIQQIASAMSELYSSAKGLAEAYGADTSSGFFAYGDAASTTLGAISKVAAAFATGNPLQIAIAALTGIMESIAAFAGASDAELEAEIQTEQKRIEALQRAYERLEKQIERTYDTVSYMEDYNQQVANIRSQIDALEKQRAAEVAKKNTDEDKVQGYTNAIEDAYDKLEELEQKQIEVFGGIGKDNYRSWAEGFVDAWKSAFLETGDGLDALQDHFDEFLQQWFVKQATMRIAGKALEGVMGDIDSVVSDDGIVDWNELQAIRSRMETILPDLNDKLIQFAGMFDLGDTGSLSGLAAGIQGMTEEQANILEAYWNSVRMYTASIDMNVAQIASILGAGGVNTNPQLEQMRLVAQNTKATMMLLKSATANAHPLGGIGFKVFID